MEQLKVIKVGGKIVEENDTLNVLLNDYAKVEGRKILVHGGGRSATKISAQLGIETQMIDGRRVTDAATLKVVTMVYAGLVNKTIVASLQARGINAIGVCGADAGIILSNKRPATPIDYGYVGDVVKVDGEMLSNLLKGGTYPVVAPITHDGKGNLLNTNADTIASEVAKGLADKFEELKASGVVSGGMLPKLQSAFKALESGVKEVVITHASAIGNPNAGTHIVL